ncbi:Crp/Fnr family transcriptional regulator [Variovorax sp. RA8]|uniref:Crp/Fnr family transcriptional regulator n=1 Tax=Variovorax sp. (strain JCM 16519 / RA8) TaxID=662548 RepID=UPI000AAA81D2|nr:cyclic nucleotide-binding domain-containing protein [Variovorax sp. RA8]VTU19214.1 DNA-binding transcriptional dual regulator Crp [Variovorax sp. RA8]
MPMPALFDTAVAALYSALATPSGIVALCSAGVAGLLIIVSSFVKTMIPLRCLAIGGNLGFLIYGALHPSLILVLLHGALLPINVFRAAQMVRLTRRVQIAAASNDLSGVWLRPYMRRRRLRKDAILFRKGDPAKRLYFLAEGRIEFVEIGQTMEPGRLFGEIGFFAPDKRRTLTARCATPCTVLQMDEMTFKSLYFQNPAFGFEVVTLVAGRLLADRQRLEDRLATVSPPL